MNNSIMPNTKILNDILGKLQDNLVFDEKIIEKIYNEYIDKS